MKTFFITALILALIVAGVGLFNQQAQVIEQQAESNQVLAQVLQSLARVIEQQAAANVELMQAQAGESRALALLYTALAFVLFVLGGVAVGIFLLVVNAHRKEKRQPPQVVYIQAPEYYQALPAGHAMVVYPHQVQQKESEYVR